MMGGQVLLYIQFLLLCQDAKLVDPKAFTLNQLIYQPRMT
jgi:hypothetical protein